jgi:hypothetical protein
MAIQYGILYLICVIGKSKLCADNCPRIKKKKHFYHFNYLLIYATKLKVLIEIY